MEIVHVSCLPILYRPYKAIATLSTHQIEADHGINGHVGLRLEHLVWARVQDLISRAGSVRS